MGIKQKVFVKCEHCSVDFVDGTILPFSAVSNRVVQIPLGYRVMVNSITADTGKMGLILDGIFFN